jgi:O-antigen ligase
MGWFAVLASPKRVPAVARLVLGFLVALGLFGVLESAFPESIPFAILRSDDSLSITPRVASLMPWPNQYGVAMIVGLALVEILVGCRGLAGRPAWPVRVLLLSQIAQSGSRNAWLVLTATVALLVVRRITPWRRAVILAALFAGIVLTLPVPARQLGLRHGSWLPPANQMIDEPLGWSPSLSPVGLSVDLRSQLWSEAVTAIERHPITGLGPNVFQATAGLRVMNETGFNTHDLLLELWVGIGTVGLILIGLAVVLAWRVRPPGAVVTGVPLAVMLLGQVFDCYTHDPTMVVLMALATAAVWSGTGDP